MTQEELIALKEAVNIGAAALAEINLLKERLLWLEDPNALAIYFDRQTKSIGFHHGMAINLEADLLAAVREIVKRSLQAKLTAATVLFNSIEVKEKQP